MSIIKAIMLFLAAKGEYSRDSSTEKDDLHNQDKTDYSDGNIRIVLHFQHKIVQQTVQLSDPPNVDNSRQLVEVLQKQANGQRHLRVRYPTRNEPLNLKKDNNHWQTGNDDTHRVLMVASLKEREGKGGEVLEQWSPDPMQLVWMAQVSEMMPKSELLAVIVNYVIDIHKKDGD